MRKAAGRAERLLQMEALLLAHPEGLRKVQLAARLGVERSTAGRCVEALTALVPIVEEDDGRLWIDRARYLPPVRLSGHEIESIRLAFRLFSRKIRLPFPPAAVALRKLALATERASPHLSRRLGRTADSLDAHPARARTARPYPDDHTKNYRNVKPASIAQEWHLAGLRAAREEGRIEVDFIDILPWRKFLKRLWSSNAIVAAGG